MNPNNPIGNDSPAWRVFVQISFGVSLFMMLAGVWMLTGDIWMKAFFTMGTLFLTGSCFMLAKTMRDQFESDKLINRIEAAKTEQILKDYHRSN